MVAIKYSFSLRGLAPGVTEEGLTGFFTSLGAAVVSVRMMPGGAYVNVSAGEPAKVTTRMWVGVCDGWVGGNKTI
jgi:hypothetical protein